MTKGSDFKPADLRTLPARVRLNDTRDGSNDIVSKDDVIKAVHDSGMDVILVTDKADIPVYRLVDIGKLQYQQNKAAKANKQATQKGKKFVFSPGIGDHDYDTKMRQLRQCIGVHEITISSIRNFRTSGGFPRNVSMHQLSVDPDFILSRVLNDLKDELEVKSRNVGNRSIEFILKPVTKKE